MTLDEAIKRYTNNAEYERTHGNLQGCLDFRQLAEWLTELKQLRERTKWIPIERLPESDEEYHTFLVTDSKGRVTLSEFYLSASDGKPYWSGMIDVIAWMPLPEQYRAESETKQ